MGTFNANPITGCMELAKHAMRWLKGVKEKGILINPEIDSGLEVSTDSDWGGMYSIMGDPRSRSGILITYNNVPVISKSSWQNCKNTQCGNLSTLLNHDEDDQVQPEEKLIAQSSTEAEVYALAEGAKLGLHIYHLAEELRMETPLPIQINVDSTGAIGFARNNAGVGKMKHIDLRSAWVEQLRDTEKIGTVQTPGTSNPADYFTKILPRAATMEHIDTLLHDVTGTLEDATMKGSAKTLAAAVQGSVENLVSSSNKKRGRAAGKRKKKRN